MKKIMTKNAAMLALLTLAGALPCVAAFEHCIYDSMPLDGEWEMSYRSNSWDSVEYPQFKGVEIKGAVPGFWEDMIPKFRAAGMTDSFWMNPQYAPEHFPIARRARDMTIPGIFGCFFYRKTVRLDEVRRAVVAFDCVRNQVHVWVNGKFVAFRQGFSTPFELPIPNGALREGENEIVLAVSNNPNKGYNGADVSGLTTRGLFASTGGIDGRLELRFARNGLGDVYVTTAKDLKTFTVHVGTARPEAAPYQCGYEISDSDGKVIAKGEAKGDFTLPTKGFAFWSPENPVRYTLTLATPEGKYSQKFGIRRLVPDGERMRLNGELVYLRGVTEHCYFAETVHLPRDLAYYRTITAKRKELGFNFVRFHTYIPPEEYLEAMDELGMLVHIESPNFVTLAEYEAIIHFARKHPSVVIYCTGNETMVNDAVEKYLEDVAGIVHRETDSLFAPISCLWGVDACIGKNQRTAVNKPFRHDPVRLARLAKFTDIFMTHHLGVSSYDSLDKLTAADMDAWGDAYCGHPRSAHEICINGTFADLSLEKDYPPGSPILASGFLSEVRKQLEKKGLVDKAETYAKNSAEWARRVRKFTFEKVRSMKRMAGYDFLGDVNGHWHTYGYFVGMMDEFFRLKHGETVENVLRYNSAAVLLADLGSDFNVTAGEAKRVAFSVSNYDADAPCGTLRVSLVGPGGDEAWWCEAKTHAVLCGEVSGIGGFDVMVPAADKPAKYLLRATFSAGSVRAENEWEVYAFPRVVPSAPAQNLHIVSNISRDDLLAAMARGERVLLLGAGPFNSLPTTYQIIIAGRSLGRNSATVVKQDHPALADFPNEGFCGWQFRRLMDGGRAVQLEADIPFDPIVDVVGSDKCIIRQSSLFEYKVGGGRLLVCSFKFGGGDPAAVWLKKRLVEYAASDAFNPAQSLSLDQLRAVIDAPLISDKPTKNENVNPNDPARAPKRRKGGKR